MFKYIISSDRIDDNSAFDSDTLSFEKGWSRIKSKIFVSTSCLPCELRSGGIKLLKKVLYR